jgi:AcrR family transcriptional regulator
MASATSGRPRDPRIDAAVLAATRELLVQVGWEGMSLRSIATRAGVGRAALHRRWPSKAHLVLDAILGSVPDLSPFEGTDRAGWVRWVVDGSAQLFGRPEVRAALPGLLAALRDHDDLRATIWMGFSTPATELFAAGETTAQSGAAKDARAALVLAAGAALFLSVIAREDDTPEMRDRLHELLVKVAR